MTLRTAAHPDPTRTDVGAALFSTWRVGTPERQQATVDAIARTWLGRPWPDDELRSYNVYAGEDGTTLLHHSQWSGEPAYLDFVQKHRQERVDEIDRAVPGIERLELNRTRLYRSAALDSDPRVPGAVVIVEAVFEGPDPGRQRAWVDAVMEALETDPGRRSKSGGISGHFHLSFDGTKVINYAEWESVQAHVDALAAPGEGVGSATEQWQRVQNFPGLRHDAGGVNRYVPALGLIPG